MASAPKHIKLDTTDSTRNSTTYSNSDDEELGDNYSSLSIPIEVGGLKVDALVNTFSTLTHISLSLAERLSLAGLTPHCASASVQTIDQRVLETVKVCPLDVVYKGKATALAALVIPYLAKEVVLGNDFLRQRNCELLIEGNALPTVEGRRPMSIESLNFGGSAIPTTSSALNGRIDEASSTASPWTDLPLEITTYPPSALQYTNHLFEGIVIRKMDKPQRRQFIMHREGKPSVKVTILNKELARLRSMGQEKIVNKPKESTLHSSISIQKTDDDLQN